MLINEALKAERKKKGLTQQAFSEGICSEGNYSKIESGKQRITANDLFLLLSKNYINYSDFIQKIQTDYCFGKNNNSSEEQLKLQVANAFYSRDVDKLKQLDFQIQNGSFKADLKRESNVLVNIVQKNVSKISPKVKQEYFINLFTVNNWFNDVDKVRLFSNTMNIFDDEELNVLISKFLRQSILFVNGNVYELEIASGTLVNYLYLCYSRRIDENNQFVFEKLNQLPEIPELFVYKCLGNYCKYLLLGKPNKAEEIKAFMSNNGLSKIMENHFL